MSEKLAVTISRHWHEPKIHTQISGEGIAMAIPFEDFLLALTVELYDQGRWVSRNQLESKVHQAALSVLAKIKEESTKVV